MSLYGGGCQEYCREFYQTSDYVVSTLFLQGFTLLNNYLRLEIYSISNGFHNNAIFFIVEVILNGAIFYFVLYCAVKPAASAH